jgi:uncharacterized protein (TIGR02118 family)
MISVMVLYPNKPGSRFDLDYYVNRHLPLVRERLAPMGMIAMTYATEAALGASAGAQTYRLVADLRFNDMETTRRALAAHGPETQADIPNFTDVTPVILIAEVRAG